jgi:lysophospholipase L1-like esterase
MALLSAVNRLRQDNISVIIISMPTNPYYSDRITESSRQNFSAFLNETGIPWYDYEREYPSAFFIDEGHMNSAGRADFSQKLAELIANNEKQGA